MRTNWSVSMCCALVLTLSSAARAGPFNYEVHVLAAEDDWDVTIAAAINDADHVVGARTDAGFRIPHALHWTGGAVLDIATAYGLPIGKAESQALGISNTGWIVGSAFATDPSDLGTAVRWDVNTASFVDLGLRTAGFAAARATGVNDQGDAVGFVFDSFAASRSAYFWSTDGQSDHVLDPLAGKDSSQAERVNSAGMAIGASFDRADFSYRATLWDAAGVAHDIHALVTAANPDVVISFGTDITEHGTVVGWARTAAFEFLPFEWHPSTGVVFLDRAGTPGGLATSASGEFRGGYVGDFFAFESLAAIWFGPDTPSLLSPLAGFDGMDVLGVNRFGTATGSMIFDGNLFAQQGSRAYIATRVPEPSTLALMGLALTAVVFVRRRRRPLRSRDLRVG